MKDRPLDIFAKKVFIEANGINFHFMICSSKIKTKQAKYLQKYFRLFIEDPCLHMRFKTLLFS